MDHEFIAEIETWGSGGRMADVITLKNGKIVLVTEDAVVVYASRAAFDAGTDAMSLRTMSAVSRELHRGP